jgi:lysophospholipase L1-like esterase
MRMRDRGGLIAALFMALLAGSSPLGQQSRTADWVTAWSTSQQTLGDIRVSNTTVRIIARTTIGGDAIRIRLDNTFGADPLLIGQAYVGHRARGSALVVGSNRPISFGGARDVSIPAGGRVWSDPVSLKVLPRQDLAVSLYIPAANVRPSQHSNGLVTSFRSNDGSGDVAAEEGGAPFKSTMTALWWLKAIDVQSAAASGTIVAFGDSITDGTCSTLDAHDRWEDLLSIRLGLEQAEAVRDKRAVRGLKAVVNEGIGGNTLTREGLVPPPDSLPGLERLERDVLSHHGVTDVILFMGTNDIRRGATAAGVISAMTSVSRQVKAKGIRIVAATMVPRHNVAPSQGNSGWNEQKTRIKNEVNQWIRTKGAFDGVLDFAEVIRDPANPDLLFPPFNCGDGIHPSVLGYYEMGKSIDLGLFRQEPGQRRRP